MGILNKRGQPTQMGLNTKPNGNSSRNTNIVTGRRWLNMSCRRKQHGGELSYGEDKDSNFLNWQHYYYYLIIIPSLCFDT